MSGEALAESEDVVAVGLHHVFYLGFHLEDALLEEVISEEGGVELLQTQFELLLEFANESSFEFRVQLQVQTVEVVEGRAREPGRRAPLQLVEQFFVVLAQYLPTG